MSARPRHAAPARALARSRALVAAALAALAALAACDTTGTISFHLVFPPGQTRLPDGTTLVRLTLDSPPTVREVPVAADGSFTVSLAVGADGSYSHVTLLALDAAGTTLAVARSPVLPITAYDDLFALYVSPPGAFAEAPASLSPARAGLAATALSFGVLLAGGADATGAPADALAIYDAYTHELHAGPPLPAARAGLTAIADTDLSIFLFGGVDASAAPAGDLWRFDSGAPADQAYLTLDGHPELARTGAHAARLDDGRYLITGDPLVLLDPLAGTLIAIAGAPAAALTAETATTLRDGRIALVGPDGVVLLGADGATFTATTVPGRRGAAAVRLPDGRLLLIGGADPATGVLVGDAVGLDAAGAPFTLTSPLIRPRRAVAAALAGDELVIAGGFDQAGAALDDAEILDATTLAGVRRTPLVRARGGAAAIPLGNDAVLLAGGSDAEAGAPVGLLEIYQPR